MREAYREQMVLDLEDLGLNGLSLNIGQIHNLGLVGTINSKKINHNNYGEFEDKDVIVKIIFLLYLIK